MMRNRLFGIVVSFALALGMALTFAGFGSDSVAGELYMSGVARYERVACYDPALGCEAARSVAPAGWQVGGQAYWTMQSGAAPATIDFFIASPDGSARVGYVSTMSFVQPDAQYQLTDGQWYSRTVCPVKTYQNPQTYAQAYFQEYTGIPNVEVTDVQYPEGEAAQAIQDYVSTLQQTIDAQTSQFQLDPQYGGISSQYYGDAAEVTLRFDMNSVPCKARAFVMIVAYEMVNTQNIPYYGQTSEWEVGWDTGPTGFRYYMAEESRFDEYEAAAGIFQENLILNEQWSGAVRQVSDKLFAEQIQSTYDQIIGQQEAFQQVGAQYVFQSEQDYSYSSSGGSSGYDTDVMGGWTNAITDQSYYEGPDGGHVLLDSSDYHYTDGSSIYSSPDPLDIGGTGLSPLTDLGAMGGD